MSNKEKYKEIINKAYRKMDLTPCELAEIAINPIEAVVYIQIIKHDGILKYKIIWENSASKSVGNVKMNCRG